MILELGSYKVNVNFNRSYFAINHSAHFMTEDATHLLQRNILDDLIGKPTAKAFQ